MSGFRWGRPLWIAWSCVWFAHIGMDRMASFGLKHSDGFKHTHLGTLGP